MSLDLKVPPIPLMLLLGLIAWLIARFVPALTFDLGTPLRWFLAVMTMLPGISIAIAGGLAFRRNKTTVNPLAPEKASAIVTEGVYRYSRNPMYVGLTLILTGWILALGNPVGIVLLPIMVWWLNRFQIEPEERALADRFGDTYDEYCRSVPRWV